MEFCISWEDRDACMVLLVIFNKWKTCFFHGEHLPHSTGRSYTDIHTIFNNYLLSTGKWGIEYSIWPSSLREEDLNLHHKYQLSWQNQRFGCKWTLKEGVTPSFSSSIQSSRQLEQTALSISTLSVDGCDCTGGWQQPSAVRASSNFYYWCCMSSNCTNQFYWLCWIQQFFHFSNRTNIKRFRSYVIQL